VDFEESAGIFQTISAFQFNERNNFGTLGQGPTGSRIRYRILGQNLKMIPAQDAPGTYRIWYVPTFFSLVNETDVFDDLNGFGEYVVVDCAIKMLAKEESSTTEFVRQKTALINRIEAMAASRDAGEPQTIIDIGQVSFNQRRAF
jgi:hypothetical protein